MATANEANIHRIAIIALTNNVVTTVNQLLSQGSNYRANQSGFTLIGSSINIIIHSIVNYIRFENDAAIYFGPESK
ncbi:hypothetical protein [Bacteroides pyogenes]|uniref:Uncharacterized protein n=1 Tax=Bacteroides pyogenes TaxID=310300 RepID=A0A5D3FMJ9_9BACE|nr:hypothetical protein [Bacteroides pyogenes]MCI7070648.1 hypothetical protein [Bacteroides pyogenes]TYK32889.1 hypothetical protein FNJ60_10125 [Bacteroides pyogenes]TYK50017.1 hypothetical protein FNG97_04980 [Bacteroides pyogenes]